MIRISKLADYACLIMLGLLKNKRILSAMDVSEQTGLNASTVQKVLKLLKKAHLVEALRGAQGGYSLVENRQPLTLLQVIEAIDGPIALTECAHPDKACHRSSQCISRAPWLVINQEVHNALSRLNLKDLLGKDA